MMLNGFTQSSPDETKDIGNNKLPLPSAKPIEILLPLMMKHMDITPSSKRWEGANKNLYVMVKYLYANDYIGKESRDKLQHYLDVNLPDKCDPWSIDDYEARLLWLGTECDKVCTNINANHWEGYGDIRSLHEHRNLLDLLGRYGKPFERHCR